MERASLGDRWAFSKPHREATERKRGSSVIATLTGLFMIAMASVALADLATGQSIAIDGNAADTNSLSVTVAVAVTHCPPGGDLQALEVAFRNSTTDPWTTVHAAATAWPGSDADGCTSGAPTAPTTNFAWTLASGGSGARTVYARFKHATDEAFADDSINFTAPPSDTTPPVITYTVNGEYPPLPDGDSGWYVSDAVVDWTVSDPESAVTETGCVDTTISADTTGTTLTCSASSAGGSAGPVSVTIMRDATAPSISASLSPASPATSGWYNIATGAPTVSFTCSDDTSLIRTCPASHLFLEGENQSHSGTAYDNAGNPNSAGVTNVDVDLTAPAINVTGFNNNDSFLLGSLPTAGCSTPTDATSGVDSSTLSGPTIVADTRNGNGVGDVTYRCSVSDNAGNPGSNTRLFHVNYALDGLGIRQPINQDNSSLFKRGQVVPVKFGLPGDEPLGLSTSGWSVKRRTASCTAFDAEDAVLETVPSATASSLIRYDSSADQYIYNADFRTVTLNTCWQVGIVLDDPGSTTIYSAIFKMVK